MLIFGSSLNWSSLMVNNKKLTLLMILAMVAWGSTWVSAKVLMEYFNAYSLIFWRFSFSALGLAFVLAVAKIGFKIDKKGLILSLISAFGLIAYNYFFFLGTHYGEAGFGGVLVTTLNPILTFIFIAILGKKLLDLKDIVALMFGAIGVLLILKIWQLDISYNRGVIYFLLAAATWPFITILSSYFKSGSALIFSFYMFSFTAIGTLVIFLNLQLPTLSILDTIGWINMFALSIYATTFGTSIYFMASSKWGGKKASGYFFLVPFTAVIFATIFLNENIDIFTIIGGLFTILAIYQLNGYNFISIKKRVAFWKN